MAELSAEHKFVCDFVDRNEKAIALLGDSIFYFGELGMQEFETSKLMADLPQVLSGQCHRLANKRGYPYGDL